MANVLGELFQNIADAIRSKTGSTDTLKPNQFPEAIEGITTGGGSSADVRYVTFMNGDTVLYKKPVAVGDDCVDVLTKGLIETPTKESTAQYNYTFYGWGASDGGAADTNILKNIRADKTVYAIFTATVRMYTITWLDEDGTELPGQKQWAYGTVPSYIPLKEGYGFGGWNPAPVAVTGDASYTAIWMSVLASGTCGTNTTYELSSDYTLTISGTGATSNWSSSSSNRPPWYNSYNSKIKKVVVREGVTGIGDYAFFNSSVLTEVVISSTVTSIGASAFYYCPNVESVSIPSTSKLTSILGSAFSGCSKMDITIPSSVTNYGGSAFYKCKKITEVTIPSGATLGTSAFNSCTGLKTAVINSSDIPNQTFTGCTALKEITIGDSVTSIGQMAFSNCRALVDVTIGDSVTTIGAQAFNNCTSLTDVTIGDSVTTIEADSFNGCTALSGIHLSDNNTAYSIANGLLYSNDGTKLLLVPRTLTGSFVVPSAVTSIGGGAFAGCAALTNITVTDTVTSIGKHAFNGCKSLASFTIPNSLTSIEGYTFAACTAITSITIPASITKIGSGAFANSGLTSATFENANGWKADTTTVQSAFLANTSTAAKYLTSNYVDNVWTRT